jgi:eukaryotic-like serine/threonine-protein kinase
VSSDSPLNDRSGHAVGARVGKFRLLAHAGQGGMGTVWKAEDAELGRTVALKFLPEQVAQSADARGRFLRGARAAGRLSHPGVATVFESGELEGRLFIAIEWVDGETISDLASRGPMPTADAVRIARDSALALAHAHAHGVLHRDVSGRNIMVARDGRVVILDFGLALRDGTSRITSSSATVGTMPYLAPEVILGSESSAQSDLYGLGVVFYEMLTGTLPFRGERPEAVLYAVVNEPLEACSKRCPDVPSEVEAIVARTLARDPAARFSGAEEFAKALAALDSAELRRLPERSMKQDRRGLPSSTPDPQKHPPRYLVVLPFQNMHLDDATDAGRDLFALGVTDTVSAQLARYAGILVVTVAPGVSAETNLREIARTSGADAVLRGTIQRSGVRMRISFSLIDPIDGRQIGGDVFDGALNEVFLLQDLLARRVADLLQPGVASVTALPLRTGLEAVAAQEQYLQALGYLQRSDNEAQVDGAFRLLTALRDNGNDSAVVEAALGRACLLKYQFTHDRIWETRAQEACGRALELDPRSAEVHLTLGNLQRVSGKWTEAARSFRLALKMRPDHPEALFGLARTFESENKLVEAEETYLRAMALRPNFWEPFQMLGIFYFNHGRYERAIQLWTRVAELTPDNARAHLNLGGAYFRLERFDEAIACFNRSIAIRPEATAYSNLGTLHYFLGHWFEAAGMFEKAVALRPNVPRLSGNLGDAYRWIPGREADAAAAYDRAISLMRGELELNPKSAESLGWLAEWMARRGDTRGAVQHVRRALKLAPDDVNGMARAVNVFWLAGDRAEALRWIDAAVRAGYGLAEFERDPDLKPLRDDVAYARLLIEFKPARSGRETGSSEGGEPGRNTERGVSP